MNQESLFDAVKSSALLFGHLIPFSFCENRLPAPISHFFVDHGPRFKGKLGETYQNIMAYSGVVASDVDPKQTTYETTKNLVTNYIRTARIISNPTNPASYRPFGHIEADEEAQPFLKNKGPFIALSVHTNGDFDCLPKAEEIFNQNGNKRNVVVAIGPQPQFIEDRLNLAFSEKGITMASTKNLRGFSAKCLTAFKANGGAALHADVETQIPGIPVRILGKETDLPAGIFGMAEKKKVPIIPFTTYVDENNHVNVRIGKPIEPCKPEIMAQSFANQMDIMIRKNPKDVFAFSELELKDARR